MISSITRQIQSVPLITLMVALVGGALAQPAPGDQYREYVWLPTMVKESEKFLRVGGRLDYQHAEEHMPSQYHAEGFLSWDQAIDLEGATRAELVLEMVQSHEDTRGLTVEINGHIPLSVPEMVALPQPQSAYMLHAYPIRSIPLDMLHPGKGNRFRLTVDSAQVWNWPQNLIYGIILRIYYETGKSKVSAQLTSLPDIWTTDTTILMLESRDTAQIQQVDFFGLYTDFNWEGDGRYRQWHGHPHRGKWRNHLGTAMRPPFSITWHTDWLPDQHQPIYLMARVLGVDSIITITEAAGPYDLERSFSVELCRPYHQPRNWVTRADTFSSGFAVHGPLSRASAYQVAWRSWSPCYARGLWINDHKIWDRADPCYAYAEHLLTIDKPQHLRKGENIIKTGMTPLINDQMVHGMEVQYPGVMVKVKYQVPSEVSVSIAEGVYERRPHFIITTPSVIYYLDQRGGGLSRMLDRDGHDWIDFRMHPWDQYPQSAAAAFRGIPNLVFGSDDSGAGHPGHDQCKSEIVNDSTILVTSISEKWQWQWTFHHHSAVLEILRVDPDHPYWFLYEGVPGGRWQPQLQYFGTNTGGPRFEPLDYYKGDKVFEQWQWAYFGHQDVDRVLYIAQGEADDLADTFSYLGNAETGIDADDGMVVFGFGRAAGAKPLLRKPHTFRMGFIDQRVNDAIDHREISAMLQDFRSKQK